MDTEGEEREERRDGVNRDEMDTTNQDWERMMIGVLVTENCRLVNMLHTHAQIISP